jgi:hypothetical protein
MEKSLEKLAKQAASSIEGNRRTARKKQKILDKIE